MTGPRRLLAALALLGVLAPASARAEAPACGAPSDLLEAPVLPSVASGVGTGRLHILAVGSASITSPGVSGAEATWSARLRAIIDSRRPGLDIRVMVRGGRGQTAADQWATIEAALREGRPDLVIWQAGATEAVRGLPVDELEDTLTEGLRRLHARGIDVVVMDLQFSRFLRANADIEPYRRALRISAAAGEAALFPRYALMHAWADAGTVDLERTPRADRTRAVDRLNDCLAQAMADFLRSGSRAARR
ncbi:hypothetical protein [Roseomonas sp. HF4]|uniref:SGNH/GDSL hydrolase family protein n=1 Tax=Roseomonas sp. HF4 TaxID=2562313 RepID=UPI0010C06B2D|nr:hypothetical protein [Roseomonas sp. HF4]